MSYIYIYTYMCNIHIYHLYNIHIYHLSTHTFLHGHDIRVRDQIVS